MSRNLKALGLALVAAFALSAVAASAASAHTPAKFTTANHWTVLHAKALNNQRFTENNGGTEFTCGLVLSAHGSAVTEQESITVEPTNGTTTAGKPPAEEPTDCVMKSGGTEFPGMVHTNGCHYVFAAGGTVDGSVSITCPVGKSIEVTAFIIGAWRQCMDISAQTPTKPTVDYTNETEVTAKKNVWDVRVKSTVEGITYTKTGFCGEGTFHNYTYHGEFTVWGTDTANNPVDVTWDKTVA